MPGETDNTDIITDSEELELENDEQLEEVETDPRELIANNVTSKRAEKLEETDNLNEALDLSTNDESKNEVDEIEDPAPETVTVKVNGTDKEVTQEELVRSYQIDSATRSKLQETSALKKELDQGLADVAKMKADLEKDPPQQAQPVIPDQDDFDLEGVVTKLREGSDDEAVEAMQNLTNHLHQPVKPQQDVNALVDQRLSERDAEAVAKVDAALATEFKDAETSFNSDFATDISSNPDFFDLAAMEDRKLVNDPEWQDKPVGERLTEAGNRAKVWVSDGNSAQVVRDKQTKKERHVHTNGGTKRTNIGKEAKVPTRTSVIADMAAERGQVT